MISQELVDLVKKYLDDKIFPFNFKLTCLSLLKKHNLDVRYDQDVINYTQTCLVAIEATPEQKKSSFFSTHNESEKLQSLLESTIDSLKEILHFYQEKRKKHWRTATIIAPFDSCVNDEHCCEEPLSGCCCDIPVAILLTVPVIVATVTVSPFYAAFGKTNSRRIKPIKNYLEALESAKHDLVNNNDTDNELYKNLLNSKKIYKDLLQVLNRHQFNSGRSDVFLLLKEIEINLKKCLTSAVRQRETNVVNPEEPKELNISFSL